MMALISLMAYSLSSACGLRLAACGSRFAARGSRLAACGLRLAVCGLRLAQRDSAQCDNQATSSFQVTSMRGRRPRAASPLSIREQLRVPRHRVVDANLAAADDLGPR